MELVNLNLQTIAKWFENGCEFEMMNDNENNENGGATTTTTTTNHHHTDNRMANGGRPIGGSSGDCKEDGYYILECNDICLLSKLSDIKCDTLLSRVHKQMMTITNVQNRKTFLLSIVNEFLRDGRKTIALQAINDEIDNRTELYQYFKSDLLFYRALCHFKLDRPTEALIDMYGGLDNSMIRKIDSIHRQLMEETAKFLKTNKLSNEQVVTVKDSYQMTLIEILKQYEFEVSRLCQQQQQQQQQIQQLSINDDPHHHQNSQRHHTTTRREHQQQPKQQRQIKNSGHHSWKLQNNNDFLNISTSNSSYNHWPRLQQNSSSSSPASLSLATTSNDRITSLTRSSQTTTTNSNRYRESCHNNNI
ncbi:hypothetical protein HUG17_5898 [Dermatophagoides farinae]|uniref:Uncharacterized protein n=1 Tax=Dermatophagoides farinae TaxID=6954 RepID=A0A9D4SJC4_DERFA|nr:hypothetical protein HUG17_5898 [Dermatophagoides farinae]